MPQKDDKTKTNLPEDLEDDCPEEETNLDEMSEDEILEDFDELVEEYGEDEVLDRF
jgi:hypothetical protein